ncbi:MAG: hypothetical protein KF729_04905 [Sandaracinaceae bacterium]|nr:hypothetical protein [Sandaracinaceae bacterium]
MRPTRNRVLVSFLATCFGLTACASRPPTEAGEPCVTDEECATGMCASPTGAGRRVCTLECAGPGDCPAERGLSVCHPSGLCAPPCAPGETLGDGAERLVCRGGVFLACRDTDSALTCAQCGCAPFGGGTCTSRGCLVPRALGEACEHDEQCESRLCLRDTRTCGAPRAMGEACSVDLECESRNCSADGDPSRPGRCNQPLGTRCESGSTTCSSCIGTTTSFDGSGLCSRRTCHPTHAPNCPVAGGRTWECASSVDGLHRCYERCDPLARPSYQCFRALDLCERGYCQ